MFDWHDMTNKAMEIFIDICISSSFSTEIYNEIAKFKISIIFYSAHSTFSSVKPKNQFGIEMGSAE